MSNTTEVHWVYIVNEKGRSPSVTPKKLAVSRNDHVVFAVVGVKDDFVVRPQTDVFADIQSGQDIPVVPGRSPLCTIRQDTGPFSVHRYSVVTDAGEEVDPVLIVY